MTDEKRMMLALFSRWGRPVGLVGLSSRTEEAGVLGLCDFILAARRAAELAAWEPAGLPS